MNCKLKELISSGVLQSNLEDAVKNFNDEYDSAKREINSTGSIKSTDGVYSAYKYVEVESRKLEHALLADAIDDAKLNPNHDNAVKKLNERVVEMNEITKAMFKSIDYKFIEIVSIDIE